MFWNLDPMWLALLVIVVSILSFLVALALNAVMGDDGFGVGGNTAVITAGFFGGIVLADWFGFRFRDMGHVIAFGLCGALACMLVLAALKAALSRL